MQAASVKLSQVPPAGACCCGACIANAALMVLETFEVVLMVREISELEIKAEVVVAGMGMTLIVVMVVDGVAISWLLIDGWHFLLCQSSWFIKIC